MWPCSLHRRVGRGGGDVGVDDERDDREAHPGAGVPLRRLPARAGDQTHHARDAHASGCAQAELPLSHSTREGYASRADAPWYARDPLQSPINFAT